MTPSNSTTIGTSFLRGVGPCLLASALISGMVLIAGVRTTFDVIGNIYMAPMLWLMQYSAAVFNTIAFLVITIWLTLACLLFRGAQGALPEKPARDVAPEEPRIVEFDDEKELQEAKDVYARALAEYETKKQEYISAREALSPWQRVLHDVFDNPGASDYSPFSCVIGGAGMLGMGVMLLLALTLPALMEAVEWEHYRTVMQDTSAGPVRRDLPSRDLEDTWRNGLAPTSLDKLSWFKCRRYALNHPTNALLSLSINGQPASVDACTWRSANVLEWREPS